MTSYELFKKACVSYTDDRVREMADDFNKNLTARDKEIMQQDELYIFDKAIAYLLSRLVVEGDNAVHHAQTL